jgi:uncharacterized RDD family membrane protein YckC
LFDRPNTANEAPAASGVQPSVPPTEVIPPRVSVSSPPSSTLEFGDIGQYAARRVLALLTDLIIVTTFIAVPVHHAVVQRGGDPTSSTAFFETFVYTLFALIVYRCVGEAYAGTTLGKALFGLRVQAHEGGRVGIVRGTVRNLFLPFDLLLIGFVLAAITPRHKRIGDFVAGTEVVNLRVGALAPIVALALLGGWGYLDYAYADGFRTAQFLGGDAERYAPSLVGGQSTPAPAPTPLPERTPVPTEQPITVPTIAPSGPTPSAEPSGGASPVPSASGGSPAPSPEPSPSPTTQQPTTT